MYSVVSHDMTNWAVYIAIIFTNVKKDKSVLMHHHSYIVQRCSAECSDLQEVIITHTCKTSVLVLELNLI
jgi:hypothetical protein